MNREEKEVMVGESATLSLDLQTKGPDATVWSDTDVVSATVLIYEYGDPVLGQVDSSTASTVVDADRTEADDYWNNMLLEFTSGGNAGQFRVIEDFDYGTTTFTLDVDHDALPATPAADDEYRIHNLPIISTTDLGGHAQGTVFGNTMTFQMTAANGCTASPRTVLILLKCTYTASGATDVRSALWRVEVVGNP